ncbi:hypothetical protein JCM10213v2_004698 [Rhodosporidiobolus nylandii]
MSAETTEEACWVCGKVTANRCSACEAQGMSIFFCSREHQKLIWPVHKLVCGSSSNPIAYPLLTVEESQQAKAHAYEAVRVEGKDASLALHLSRLRCTVNHLARVTRGAHDVMPASQQQRLLRLIRASEDIRLSYTGRTAGVPAERRAMQRVVFTLDAHLDTAVVPYPAWSSELEHRALTFVYLRTLLARRDTSIHRRDTSIHDYHILHAYTELRRCVSLGISMNDPVEGPALLYSLAGAPIED